jgi:hypothetical protein
MEEVGPSQLKKWKIKRGPKIVELSVRIGLKVRVKMILLFTVHLVHFKFLKQCHTINYAETIQVTYQGHAK